MLIVLVTIAILATAAVSYGIYRLIRIPGVSSRWMERALTSGELELRASLMRDVASLASLTHRNEFDMRALAEARNHIRESFRAAHLEPGAQSFRAGPVTHENIFAIVEGTSRPAEIVVVGAHYDTVFDSPGADDNASGVAGMLAIARQVAKHPCDRTVHFVAFATEEPPYFRSDEMGSCVYAKSLRDQSARVVSMLNIESIGFYASTPGSQLYPRFLGQFFPPVADFIAVVSDLSSRSIARRCARSFGRTGVAVEAAALPRFIDEAGWSDQWSFWKYGYRAVMVTDTALFRNPNYHTPSDTPGTLDYDRMTRVVSALFDVVRGEASV